MSAKKKRDKGREDAPEAARERERGEEREDGEDTDQESEEYYSEDDDEEEYGREGEGDEEYPRRTGHTSEWSGSSPAKDSELVDDFLRGSEQAFNRLVNKYQNKVHNLCFRIMGDRHEAQDMAQEVFMTMHKSLRYFRGDSLLSTWVYRITVNHCKNRIKFLGRRRYYRSVSIDQPLELDEGEAYFEPEDSSPTPEDIMESRQLQELVQKAISTLDPDHRLAVVLRDIEHLSYEEIAEALNIKVGTVKSRIHRARAELKDKLERIIKEEQTP